jgi:hypothetical protein
MKDFKTSRTDVKRDKRQLLLPNVSLIGYSTNLLRYGDFFTYKEYYTDKTYGIRLGRCHGRVIPLSNLEGTTKDYTKKWLILTQAAEHMMTFTYERWIEVEDVTEMIPKDKMSDHIKNWFVERQEKGDV